MSSEPIIRVEGLGKRYLLGAQRGDNGKYRTLRDTLADTAARVVRRFGAGREPTADPQEFWALRDVSFEVKPGEVVGIIGRNGAGKSTLLKVLSRITEPTQGRISIAGRVASLLEVGTGFHPELTGRENIYLNGAILGMHRREIKAKFDEIVAFAEVERFLDTPVKRYSSGMYVRLAFAVAAHLEPEILIVDEVLAVGDAEFQKKCLGKMNDVAKQDGRTVLFVSHNIGAVNVICSRALLLQSGSLLLDDSPGRVTRRYFEVGGAPAVWKRDMPVGEKEGIYFLEAKVMIKGEIAPAQISTEEAIVVEMAVVSFADYTHAEIAVRFTNHEGFPAFSTANGDCFDRFPVIGRGRHVLRAHIPPYLLAGGTYTLLIAALIPGQILFDVIDGPIQITIEELGPQASSMRDGRLGVVNPRLPWEHLPAAEPAVDPAGP